VRAHAELSWPVSGLTETTPKTFPVQNTSGSP
jgi:hypothetical protein